MHELARGAEPCVNLAQHGRRAIDVRRLRQRIGGAKHRVSRGRCVVEIARALQQDLGLRRSIADLVEQFLERFDRIGDDHDVGDTVANQVAFAARRGQTRGSSSGPRHSRKHCLIAKARA